MGDLLKSPIRGAYFNDSHYIQRMTGLKEKPIFAPINVSRISLDETVESRLETITVQGLINRI